VALVIFRLEVNVIFGVTAVLNAKPAGVLRINVTLVPAAKSAAAPSAIVMAPNVVQAGDGALAAVSAEMLPPPEAGVTVTVAKAVSTPGKAKARANKKATRVPLVVFINCVFLYAFTTNCSGVEMVGWGRRRLGRPARARQTMTDNKRQ
jgi:hypothetical protein